MALINCKVCGHQISSMALTCVKCGNANPVRTFEQVAEKPLSKSKYRKNILLFFVPFALIIASLLLFGHSGDIISSYDAAPFTEEAAREINNEFDDKGFNREISSVSVGSYDAFVLIAKYTNNAFNKAGYSLDKTIYISLNKDIPKNAILEGIFIKSTTYGSVIVGIYENKKAIIDSGILSDKTIKLIDNLKSK